MNQPGYDASGQRLEIIKQLEAEWKLPKRSRRNNSDTRTLEFFSMGFRESIFWFRIMGWSACASWPSLISCTPLMAIGSQMLSLTGGRRGWNHWLHLPFRVAWHPPGNFSRRWILHEVQFLLLIRNRFTIRHSRLHTRNVETWIYERCPYCYHHLWTGLQCKVGSSFSHEFATTVIAEERHSHLRCGQSILWMWGGRGSKDESYTMVLLSGSESKDMGWMFIDFDLFVVNFLLNPDLNMVSIIAGFFQTFVDLPGG